jgi:hypothetical protein
MGPASGERLLGSARDEPVITPFHRLRTEVSNLYIDSTARIGISGFTSIGKYDPLFSHLVAAEADRDDVRRTRACGWSSASLSVEVQRPGLGRVVDLAVAAAVPPRRRRPGSARRAP